MTSSVESAAIRRALGAVEAHLRASDGAEALLARREAGLAAPGDAAAVDAEAAAVLAAQHDDGSWGGGLLDTAEALLALHELWEGENRGSGQIERGLDWLRTRRGLPGRFGEPCDPRRHEVALCHHFLGGFFSPAPPQPSLEAVRLACGAPVPGDATVRLVASCVALQAKLRWGRYGRDVELHLEGLRRIVDLWDARDGLFTMPGFVAAVAALADAPDPESREAAARGIATLVGAQRADGTWPDVDLFQVMELLERAARTDNATPAVNAALHRSAVMLAVSIQEDGTWGLHAGTRRTLIGWRVLRYAARMQEEKSG
ncbi:MAG: hypothetical protein DIU52_006550 [bacterium]|nr:MAG: hypothetical protein DIU52_13455 [bacterium]